MKLNEGSSSRGLPTLLLLGLGAMASVGAFAQAAPGNAQPGTGTAAGSGAPADGGGRLMRGGPRGAMHGGGRMMGEAMLGRLGERLGLSESQKQRIRGILESARPEMENVRNELRSNRERLESANPGDAGYQAIVSEVSRKAGELTTRMVANGAQVRAQVWAVLTPEQRTQAETLRTQMRERAKERMKQRRELRGTGAAPTA